MQRQYFFLRKCVCQKKTSCFVAVANVKSERVITNIDSDDVGHEGRVVALSPTGNTLIVYSGDGFDSRRITLQEITVLGNYCYTHADLTASVDMLYRQQLGNLDWVEVRPLSAGGQAFDDLHHGRVAAGKIVLQPDHLVH